MTLFTGEIRYTADTMLMESELAVGDYPIYGITIKGNDFYGSRFGIRTGYWDDRIGAVEHILISGNYIHDLADGGQHPAIAIGGYGGRGAIGGIAVINNRVCRAGQVVVKNSTASMVRGTHEC